MNSSVSDISTEPILVSVVIPIYNEENYIEKCLNSVLRQDYPYSNMEINLVDGMSGDNTISIIHRYMEQYDHIHLFENPHKTVQYALNIGIRGSVGEYIVRLDAHAEYAEDYVSKCVEYLNKTGAANVGGPMIARGKTTMQKVIAAAYHSPFALGGGKFHDEHYEGYADTVFLGAFRRETIEKIGLYDERFPRSEDDELNFRFMESGQKIYITPEIKNVYYPRSSTAALFPQYYEYGLWKVAVIRKHKRPARLSHLVPVCFVLFLLLGGIASLFSPVAATFYSFILLLYLLLNVYYSFRNQYIQGFVNHLRLCWVHFILHLSYGCGFLCGLFKFAFVRF